MATDGFVVYENSGSPLESVFDSDGSLQATFTARQDLPTVSGEAADDVGHPDLHDTEATAWAAGTVV